MCALWCDIENEPKFNHWPSREKMWWDPCGFLNRFFFSFVCLFVCLFLRFSRNYSKWMLESEWTLDLLQLEMLICFVNGKSKRSCVRRLSGHDQVNKLKCWAWRCIFWNVSHCHPMEEDDPDNVFVIWFTSWLLKIISLGGNLDLFQRWDGLTTQIQATVIHGRITMGWSRYTYSVYLAVSSFVQREAFLGYNQRYCCIAHHPF